MPGIKIRVRDMRSPVEGQDGIVAISPKMDPWPEFEGIPPEQVAMLRARCEALLFEAYETHHHVFAVEMIHRIAGECANGPLDQRASLGFKFTASVQMGDYVYPASTKTEMASSILMAPDQRKETAS